MQARLYASAASEAPYSDTAPDPLAELASIARQGEKPSINPYYRSQSFNGFSFPLAWIKLGFGFGVIFIQRRERILRLNSDAYKVLNLSLIPE